MPGNDPGWAAIVSQAELVQLIETEPALLTYFSSAGCAVCLALRPKVEALLRERFPRIRGCWVDCQARPQVAAQAGVFSVPTVVVWFDGRETVRLSGGFAVGELAARLERPYRLMFS